MRSLLILGVALGTLLATACPPHSAAWGQAADPCADFPYDQLQPLATPQQRAALEAAVSAARSSGTTISDTASFDRYYREYVFASLTSCRALVALDRQYPTPEAVRRDYIQKELTRLGSGPVYERITSLSLTSCKEILAGHFHPAARVNAALILGGLNSREATAGDPASMPVPLPDALAPLLERIEDPKESSAIKVAAMIGVERHASLKGVPDAERAHVIQAVLPLLAGSSDISPRESKDAARWVRSRAADVLGALGSPGAKGEVIEGLATIVEDKKADLKLASRAALALGKLDYSQANYEQTRKLAAAVAATAVRAFKEEDELATKRQEAVVTRRLKYYFHAAFVGLGGASAQPQNSTGLLALARNDADKRFIAALLQGEPGSTSFDWGLQRMVDIFDTDDAKDDTTLRLKLKLQADQIQEYIDANLDEGAGENAFDEAANQPRSGVGNPPPPGNNNVPPGNPGNQPPPSVPNGPVAPPAPN